MAGSVNKVILIGNLGKDPEIRMTNAGKKIANMRIATSESWKDKTTGDRQTRTEWHSIVIFNENLAQLAENYLHKGSKVYIEGQLATRKWTDKDGKDRYSTEIILNPFRGELQMLDSRGNSAPGAEGPDDYGTTSAQNSQTTQSGDGQGGAADPLLDDEIPL